MRLYTVSEVAKLSGVSVRTLHHYHDVGLLLPAAVGANGYRHYGDDELQRLQQILLHREVGLPLSEIAQVLDASNFDRTKALRAHRVRLSAQARRYRRLIRTIDETIAAIESEAAMEPTRMYRGFKLDAAEVEPSEAWLRARFGPQVQCDIERSRAVEAAWSPRERAAYMDEGLRFDAMLANVIGRGLSPASDAVQDLVRVHCAAVCQGWGITPCKAACLVLAEIYRDGPMFRQRFAQIGPGAAGYVGQAIQTYVERELS
jgi:DNA-binding transcriptional MerR regulator